jgi:hypothetical protein
MANKDARLMRYWAKHPINGDQYSKARMAALADFVLFEANRTIADITGQTYAYNDAAKDNESLRHKPIAR